MRRWRWMARAFVLGWAVTAAVGARAGAPVEVSCERFALRFAADGRPSSLMLRSGNRQVLDVRNPGIGFAVRGRGGGEIPMTDLSLLAGDMLEARTSNGSQQAVFRLHRSKSHIAFHLERLRGFPTTSDLTLVFELHADASVRGLEHNFMSVVENRPDGPRVRWPALWQRSLGDPPGGFSLYVRRDDADEDDTMLRVWAEEGLAHPNPDKPWTYERAGGWLADWQKRYANRSLYDNFDNLALEDVTLDRLKEAAAYAKQAGVSGVYLMPWIWRGEYWPVRRTTAEVNTEVFPGGEADLQGYARYLAGLGLALELHYVSGGIGFEDPHYVRPLADDRLATWGSGALAAPVKAEDTTLQFVPGPGVEAPYSPPAWDQLPGEFRPPALSSVHGFDIVRIGSELIRVGAFTDTDLPTWTLTGCQRGIAHSTAAAHPVSARVSGLIVAYGQNLLPGNWTTLLDEVADTYAGFLNRCGIANAAFDGFEIHSYAGFGQSEKFAAKVYSKIDHPMMSLTSSGKAPSCFLEYRFNSTRRLLGSDTGAWVDLRVDRPSWAASTDLEAHFSASQPASGGTRAIGVRDHHGGVTLEMLKTHGQTTAILGAVAGWKAVEPLLSDAQRKAIRRTDNARSPLIDSGNHPRSDTVWVLAKQSGGWEITPTRVMARRRGDVAWRTCQEHGVVGPRQYVQAGGTLALTNPFGEQAPRCVVRVLPAFDYADPRNIDLQPKARDLRATGDTTALDEGSKLVLALSNARADALWNENGLPLLPDRPGLDLSAHRGIGMWVTGDGSGAALVFQIPQRDYVAHLDFKGRRYVEIPNGEAAWADGDWGWRMGSWKIADYARVAWTRLGIGMMPATSACTVRIEGLKALREREVAWDNPVIEVGGGEVAITGSVRTGHYLTYDGGPRATVYDANWRKVADLPAAARSYRVPGGETRVRIGRAQTPLAPWLEVQFLVKGDPLKVQDAKPGARR